MPTPNQRLTLDEIIAVAIAGALKNLPGKSVKSILVTERSVKVELVEAGTTKLPLDEAEQAIVKGIGDRPAMTAEEIADLLGYPCGTWLRTTLGSMRKRGVLSGSKGEAGYAVTTPYLPTI